MRRVFVIGSAIALTLAAIVNCSSSDSLNPTQEPAKTSTPSQDPVGLPGDAGVDAADAAPPIVVPTFDPQKLQYHVNTLSPIQENRVYQRDANGRVQLTVTLDTPLPDATKLYYHLTDDTGVSQPWQEEFDAAASYTITLPQGGPYKIEMFQVDATNTCISQSSSPVFGVGDVFITAGQSNSANHGEVENTPAESFVMALDPTQDGGKWAIAADPQPLASKWSDPDFGSATNRASGSPWPAFADAMRNFTGVPIGLVSLGYGGSAARGWQPGSTWTNGAYTFDLFGRILNAAALLNKCQYKAVLWHQGESDVGTPQETYAGQLRTMINSAKSQTGCNQPWFVAKASYENGLPPDGGFSARAAQQEIIDEGTAFAGPDTDTLGPEWRSSLDGTHFSGPGLIKHGQLWAAAVQATIYPH